MSFQQFDMVIYNEVAKWILQQITNLYDIEIQQCNTANNENLLKLQNALGELLYDQNQFQKAEILFKACIDISKSTKGISNQNTYLKAMINLANLYYHQTNYIEAEKLYLECLNFRIMKSKVDYPLLHEIMKNLGDLYYNQNRLKEAEDMYKQCYETRKEILGEENLETLSRYVHTNTVMIISFIYF